MPDELEQLVEAWGRTQASPRRAGLLPPSPSAGYLAAVRRARHQLWLVRGVIVCLATVVLIWLVLLLKGASAPEPPRNPAPTAGTSDR